MIAVLFVCQANTCRSIALQGCFQHLVDKRRLQEEYYVDSCGLNPAGRPDPQVTNSAALRGIILSHIPRSLNIEDFFSFDYIIAVSAEIMEQILYLAPEEGVKNKVFLASYFSSGSLRKDMQDPYAQGSLEKMFDCSQEIAIGLLNYLERRK